MVGQIIEAEILSQRIFYVLAGALSTSFVCMLTVWALHTPFTLTCMYLHLKHLLAYEADSPLDTAEVGDTDFHACHETRAAPHLWLYVIDVTTYRSWLTFSYRFWVPPLGW